MPGTQPNNASAFWMPWLPLSWICSLILSLVLPLSFFLELVSSQTSFKVEDKSPELMAGNRKSWVSPLYCQNLEVKNNACFKRCLGKNSNISEDSYWGSDQGCAASCLRYKQIITMFQISSHSRSRMISKDLKRMLKMEEEGPPTYLIFSFRVKVMKVYTFGLKIGMPL